MQVDFSPVEIHLKAVILVSSKDKERIGGSICEIISVCNRNSLRVFERSVTGIGNLRYRSDRNHVISAPGIDEGHCSRIVGKHIIVTLPGIDGDQFDPAEVNEVALRRVAGMETQQTGPASAGAKGRGRNTICSCTSHDQQFIAPICSPGVTDCQTGRIGTAQIEHIKLR